MRGCQVEGCHRPHDSKGFCKNHRPRSPSKPRRGPAHTCEGCGIAFVPKRSERIRFCSRECYFAWQKLFRAEREAREKAEKVVFIQACRVCGGMFQPRHRARKLCSDACRTADQRRRASERYQRVSTCDKSSRHCKECGQLFTPQHREKRRHFCSDPCATRQHKRIGRLVRHAKERQVKVEAVNPLRVFERDDWRCGLCGGKTLKAKRGSMHPKAPELDHIIPLAQGGEHSYRNTQCAHRSCNSAKAAGPGGQLRLFG